MPPYAAVLWAACSRALRASSRPRRPTSRVRSSRRHTSSARSIRLSCCCGFASMSLTMTGPCDKTFSDALAAKTPSDPRAFRGQKRWPGQAAWQALAVDARDPFPRRTATPALIAPWLAELARTLPGLLASYSPRGPIDARTRERVIMAVTEINGCRYCAWIHGSWQDFLGDVDPAQAEEALLTYARACAEAGRPLDPASLAAGLAPDAVRAVQATVAQIEVANLVGNTVDGLLARATRAR